MAHLQQQKHDMKTPAFWYKSSPTGLARLLWPLAQIYRIASHCRRWGANPYHAKIPVICVGNIVAGGAGKTPVALNLAKMLLTNGNNPVFVTRGYGGKEVGPLKVDLTRHTARDVGDEALLLARFASVWVGRDRAAAIRAAEPHGSHIILDDGLQNPHISPNLTFLVIDGETGLGNGQIIPSGPLRENFRDLIQRITAVIMIGKSDAHHLTSRIRCPILHAHWQPDLPTNFPSHQKFYAFAGIARPAKFYETCQQSGIQLAGHEDFADHHFFTPNELLRLQKTAQHQGARLLTTEKDWVRLSPEWQKKITAFPVTLVFNEVDALVRLLKH